MPQLATIIKAHTKEKEKKRDINIKYMGGKCLLLV
jgi:hypothetical protein